MARLALSWVNRIDAGGVSFTAGSQVASLPASNLADPVVAKPWQTSGTVDSFVEIDLGPAQTVQLLALAGLAGFAATDTIRGRASAAKPTNLVQRSQTIDNAYWTKSNASVTANAGVAPDGTTTADKLVEDSATAHHLITLSSVGGLSNGLPYTLSFWAKNAGRTNVYVRGDDASGGNDGTVVLATGAGTMYGTPPSGVTITGTVYADGWSRCEFRFPALNGTSISNLYIGTGSGSYAGDGSSGNLIWGIQLEQGASAGGYVATTDAARTAVPDWLAEIDTAVDLTDTAGDVADGYGVWAYLAAAVQSVRYVRFDLNAASLAEQGYFRAGRAWAGPAWRPAVDASLGVETGWLSGSRLLEAARSGVVYPDRRFVRRTARLALDALGEAEARDELLEMQRLAELAGQVVLLPSPGSTRQNVETLLGYLRELPPVVQRLPALFGGAVEIEEAL